MSHRKRHLTSSPGCLSPHHHKRRPSSAAGDEDDLRRRPLPTFPSYLDDPDLPPKPRLLCSILASSSSSPSSTVASLDDSGVAVSPSDVELVLRLSYSHPFPSLAFFRWSSSRLLPPHTRHSPYSYNLLVDLLGKNQLFDPMWDVVNSMRAEGILSLATFASIFSSLAAADRPDEAVSAFLSMPLHGVPRDTPALNSLLSALCRAGRTTDARGALPRVRSEAGVSPDADSFAILLEGCENESDYRAARPVFDEMVKTVGWDPVNVPAYDSFLTTLVRSNPSGLSEAMRFFEIMQHNRCFPGIKFFRAALQAYVDTRDARGAAGLWEVLSRQGRCLADTNMYNSMISLHGYLQQTDAAIRCLDEMVLHGAFPDSQTYNVLLQFLLKSRKLREAAAIFIEMVKNECCPSHCNCVTAVRIFIDTGDWKMGVKVWKCMVANNLQPFEESGNMLVAKLRDMDLLPEACKIAEDMIDRGIKLSSSTLSKLKHSLLKVGKGSIHDHLLRKWKSH